MMRRRLRPMPDKATLDRLYAQPHRHEQWPDHRVRVDVTTTLARHILQPGGTVADLSCGDATIARNLEQSHEAKLYLGDYAPGYQYTGPIEQTITALAEPVALFVCSETLEHLDDPDAVLASIRPKAANLILSTPDGEDNDHNPEHVWGWDAEAVEKMIRGAGFQPVIHTTLDMRPAGFVYSYQIWCCR